MKKDLFALAIVVFILIFVFSGTKIQTDDPQLPGYTPKAALERDPVLCQRCFRLKHFLKLSFRICVPAMDFDIYMQTRFRSNRTVAVHKRAKYAR